MSEPSDRTPIEDLCERLTLETLDRDLYLASPGWGSGRLFGGLVAAQAVMAAFATIDGDITSSGEAQPLLHSIHAYFLRPGRYDRPIRFVVDRIRDGRTFRTRRVVAHQGGEAIFNMAASFTRPEPGRSHQRPMPPAPGPEGLEHWEILRARALGEPEPDLSRSPMELRVIDASEFESEQPRDPRRQIWIRPRGRLPDDPVLHTAALVYATDRTLLSTALRAHGLYPGRIAMGASLDHAVWLHHPIRFDDWLLYATESPVSHAARGLIFGALYRRDGVQLASVAQEALFREKRGT